MISSWSERVLANKTEIKIIQCLYNFKKKILFIVENIIENTDKTKSNID